MIGELRGQLAERLVGGAVAASGPRAGVYMIDFFGSGYDAAEAIGRPAALIADAGHTERLVA